MPFGQVQKFGFYNARSLGFAHHLGGPVITASGLVFRRGLHGQPRPRPRPRDRRSALEGSRRRPAVALPAVYSYDGRQYVAFVAGGNSMPLPRVSDQVIAFALPR